VACRYLGGGSFREGCLLFFVGGGFWGGVGGGGGLFVGGGFWVLFVVFFFLLSLLNRGWGVRTKGRRRGAKVKGDPWGRISFTFRWGSDN